MASNGCIRRHYGTVGVLGRTQLQVDGGLPLIRLSLRVRVVEGDAIAKAIHQTMARTSLICIRDERLGLTEGREVVEYHVHKSRPSRLREAAKLSSMEGMGRPILQRRITHQRSGGMSRRERQGPMGGPRHQLRKMKPDGDEARKRLNPTGRGGAKSTHYPKSSSPLHLVEELDMGLKPIKPMKPEMKAVCCHRDYARPVK